MPESQQESRGRSVIAKPLNPHPTSSKPKSTPPAATKGEGSKKTVSDRTQSTRPIPTSSKSVARSNSSAKISGQTPGKESGDNFKVTKLSSTTVKLSSTSWAPPPPPAKVPPPPPPPTSQKPAPATDSLHLAAQVYSWSYMSSTLDACFKSAEKAAINDLETKKDELTAEEAEMSDQRQRLDAQRAIEFYDELGTELFVKAAPAIMQQFHSHGDSCTNIELEALNLAARGKPNADDEEPLKPYNQMLDDLEELQNEATSLQNSITKLSERAMETPDKIQGGHEGGSGNASDGSDDPEATARQQIIGVFSACLLVLKARIANLSLAHDLVNSALENASLSLRMESLGIAD